MVQHRQHMRYDLGIATTDRHIYLYSRLSNNPSVLRAGVSIDGLQFKQSSLHPKILLSDGSEEDIPACHSFFVSKIKQTYYLTYLKHSQLSIATSFDALHWKKIATIASLSTPAILLPLQTSDGKYWLYTQEGHIDTYVSTNLVDWEKYDHPLISPRQNYFDKFSLYIGGIFFNKDAIIFTYFVREPRREGSHFSAGVVFIDPDNPSHVLWRSEKPLWTHPDSWNDKNVHPLGSTLFGGRLYFYFDLQKEGTMAISFINFAKLFQIKKLQPRPMLEKHPQNPIITPVSRHSWESGATFNSAAVYDEGKVHLLYRAQGDANTSVLGYASSIDGVTIDFRSNMPVYIPREPFETPSRQPFALTRHYMSGGGYGGCEDPRLTRIENTYYLTYVAFNGIDPPRVALSSIAVEDFHNHQWNWSDAKLISPPNVVDKNAVLFPEKINGKYVMMHRIFPNMLIDFLDDLEFKEPLKGEHKIEPRENSWDSRKIGAGPPPIKTKEGWLLIYHAVDDRDASQYKMGAMLLDLHDPRKVLYRSTDPILRPTEWYENEGYKAGVAYPCGAIVKDGILHVYYGGADTVVCVATKKLDQFLKELIESSKSHAQLNQNHAFINVQ